MQLTNLIFSKPEGRKTETGSLVGCPFLFEINGAPGKIRTCDPMIRSHVLYPAELRVRFKVKAEERI